MLRTKRSSETKRAYAGNVRAFFSFLADCELEAVSQEAVLAWLAQRPRQITLDLHRFKAALLERGLTESTINRYLAAVRALIQMAHRLELCATDARGMVDNERSQSYRDVRGLSLLEVQALLALPAKLHGQSVKGLRDTALLALLVENGLRRAEVCKLNVSDFNLSGRRLAILGKGRGTQKELVDLNAATAKDIAAYLAAAGHSEGALFRNVHRGATEKGGFRGGRLTPDGLYKLTIGYGEKIGIANARPHRLRHSTGTLAAQASGGDMTEVQKILRHKDMRVSARYVDSSKNAQAKLTNAISAMVRGGAPSGRKKK